MSTANDKSRQWRPQLWLVCLMICFALGLLAHSASAMTTGAAGPNAILPGPPTGQSPTSTPTRTPTSTCPPAWTIYPNPAPPGESTLYGVTSIRANDLWAVGNYGSGTQHSLTVHGDGTSWSIMPSPDPTSTIVSLQAVAGIAPNDVWAVGSYLLNTPRTLTEHWNGTAWTIVPSPDGGSYNTLYAVTAIAANDVWAVGVYSANGFRHPLTEHWNGSSWSIVPVSLPFGSDAYLFGVAAISTNDVWAVGTYAGTLVEHWDGTSWTRVPSPNPGPNSLLYGVSAVAANDVWAAGYYDDINGVYHTIVEHWNGSSWSVVPSPNPGATTNHLYGVSALAANNVWAVGDTDQASGGLKTLVEHWDGSAWAQVPTPDNPSGADRFNGVAVTQTGVVWAVGTGGCTTGCTQNALVARYAPLCATPTPTPPPCGLAWRVVLSPNLSDSQLKGVAVVAANDIWAVGVNYTNAPDVYAHTLTEHWNGSTWSIVPSPDVGPDFLFGVAAVASNDVWAVGDGSDGSLIEHWNGSSWSVVPNPNPGGNSLLFGVAAMAANDVWAVGESPITGGSHTLVEHWNGSSWSVVSSPNPGGYNSLHGIAAMSANDVWAVGNYENPDIQQTLIEHWNGSSWSVVPSPNMGTGYNILRGVAGVAANDVWAIGDDNNSWGTPELTLTEHWDGHSWSVVPSPNPRPSGINELNGVAAISSNDVWAAGDADSQAIIAHWDGSTWSLVPSPDGALYAMAAVAPNSVWTVGTRSHLVPAGTLIEHYNDPCGAATGTPTVRATNTATPTPTCAAGGIPGPWGTRATYPEQISSLAVASDGTNVYGFGGRAASRRNTAYKYSYSTDSWTPIPTIPAGLGTGLQAEYGHNGKIYVVGGTSEGQTANRIYDIASNSWSLGAPVPVMVQNHGHAYWNGKVYVIGGGAYGAAGNGVYAYDIASDTWSTLASLPQAEYGMASVAINGKIYIANGSIGSGVINNLYIYDINTDSWSDGPPSPLASSLPASTVVGGKFYMIGGSTPAQSANSYVYDPGTNTWSAGPSLNVAGNSGGAATIYTPGGQTAVVVGGFGNTLWLNSVEASILPNVPCATATGTPPANTPTPPATNTPISTGTATHTPPLTSTSTRTFTPGATGTATPCSLPFTDVHAGDYFYNGVRYLYCKGAISGYQGNVFLPYNNTTRGQLTKIVVLGYSFAIYTPSTPTFNDVPTNHPFYQYIETAYQLRLISGYTCGNPGEPCPGLYFRPNSLVTRGQLCKVTVLAAGWELIHPAVPNFNDVPDTQTFYTYIETAYCHQIISGYACGDPGEPCPGLYFRRNANGTRGQICKIVYNAILNYSCAPPPHLRP